MSWVIKKVKKTSPAFQRGMNARARGVSVETNPYKAWTERQEAREWQAGYDEPRLRASPPIIKQKPEQVDLEQVLPEECRGRMRS